jgi:alpha-glucosidase
MQMVPDLPENYLVRPDPFRFIVDVPTDWEDSIALAGEVGEYVVIARRERGGADWYIGAITDENPRTVSVSMAMLDRAAEYTAEIYSDGEGAHWDGNPYALSIEKRRLDRDSVLELQLAAGGGAAIRVTRQEEAEHE